MDKAIKKCTGFLIALAAVLILGTTESRAVQLSDIEGHWAEEEIKSLVGEGIVSGYGNGRFEPERKVSIAEFLKLSLGARGYSPESSEGGEWYEAYMDEAYDREIVESGEVPNPEKDMNRFEAARILSRIMGDEGQFGLEGHYIDEYAFGYFYDSILAVTKAGVMSGYPDDTFRGDQSLSRAETVVIMSRILDDSKRLGVEPSSNQENRRSMEIPVLMMHHFDETPNNISTISPKKAEEVISRVLSEGYEFIGLNDLYRYLDGDISRLPEKPIILTVDDGYKSVHRYLYPLARKYGVKISMGPIGVRVAGIERDEFKAPQIEKCSWNDMREMLFSGLVEFQNHTYDLHTLSGKSDEGESVGRGMLNLEGESFLDYKSRVLEDVMRLEDRFETELRVKSNVVVYPYGYYGPDTEVIAKEYFKGSLTTKPGIREYTELKDMWEIPRINVSEKTDILGELKKY